MEVDCEDVLRKIIRLTFPAQEGDKLFLGELATDADHEKIF